MDEELEQQLADKHPEIFSVYREDTDEITSPTPPLALFGFECGDGWFDIIDSLCEVLEGFGVETTAVQVKEKYGGLRFYHDGLRAEDEKRQEMAAGAIQMAQNMSFNVCEICGGSGEVHQQDGWYHVRCESCLKAEREEN